MPGAHIDWGGGGGGGGRNNFSCDIVPRMEQTWQHRRIERIVVSEITVIIAVTITAGNKYGRDQYSDLVTEPEMKLKAPPTGRNGPKQEKENTDRK